MNDVDDVASQKRRARAKADEKEKKMKLLYTWIWWPRSVECIKVKKQTKGDEESFAERNYKLPSKLKCECSVARGRGSAARRIKTGRQGRQWFTVCSLPKVKLCCLHKYMLNTLHNVPPAVRLPLHDVSPSSRCVEWMLTSATFVDFLIHIISRGDSLPHTDRLATCITSYFISHVHDATLYMAAVWILLFCFYFLMEYGMMMCMTATHRKKNHFFFSYDGQEERWCRRGWKTEQ